MDLVDVSPHSLSENLSGKNNIKINLFKKNLDKLLALL